jgi:hypothetical protein
MDLVNPTVLEPNDPVGHADPITSLWVMTAVVVPISWLMCSMTCSTLMPVFESSAPVGSSHISTAGRLAMARAMATRCCSPPDSCEGK